MKQKKDDPLHQENSNKTKEESQLEIVTLKKEIELLKSKQVREEKLTLLELDDLKLIFDNCPSMICLLDKDCNIIIANSKFTKAAEVENLSVSSLPRPGNVFNCINSIHDSRGCGFGTDCNSCELRNSLLDTYTTGKNHSEFQFVMTTFRNGTREDLILLVSTSRIETSSGLKILLSLVDITESKLGEEKLLKIRKALDTSGDAIFLTDINGIFTYVNPQFTTIYGYIAEEVIGKATPRILKSGVLDKSQYDYFWKSLLIKSEVKGEITNRRKNGQIVYVDGSATPILDDQKEIIGFLGIQRDVTKRKRFELEQQILNDLLHGVTSTSNLDELLTLIHSSLKKVLYAENCYIALHDQKTGLFQFPYFVDQYDEAPPPLPLGKSCTAYVFKTDKPLLVTPEVFKNLKEQNEVELVGSPSPSWLGVPLKSPSRTLGVLVLQHYSENNIYTDQDIEFLSAIGNQAAIVIERKRVEEELRNERRLLRTLIDNIPDSIFSKDSEYRNTLSNPAAIRYAGATSEDDVLGKDDFVLFPREVANKFFADDQVVITTGQPILNREELLVGENGQKKWLLTSKLPLKDDAGNVIGLVGIGRDITERKMMEDSLRESEIKLNVILESTLDGILAIDANGKVIRTNKRFAELWRIPKQIIESGNDENLLNFILDQLADPEEFLLKVQKLYNSNDHDLDLIFFKDGRIFERYTAPLIMLDSSIGRVWSFRDITENKKAEVALKELNEALLLSKNTIEENLFQQNALIEELTETKDKLEKINSEKDKFFSIIAHDLKSPFQGFINLTEMMAEDIKEFTIDELMNFGTQIHINAKRLLKLLQNLLDWAQMQKGSVDWNPRKIDLADLIYENIEMINKRGEQKGITLTVNISQDQKVYADETMLNSILRNIFANAIKFTNQGGQVIVRAKPIDNDMVEVSVTDNGIGISDELRKKLFRIEEKVGRLGTDGEESTGLGLLLCKEFVQKHGGRIWVESEEGKGSTFFFTIPNSSKV
jgi:PAS domain S-box-containing protein